MKAKIKNEGGAWLRRVWVMYTCRFITVTVLTFSVPSREAIAATRPRCSPCECSGPLVRGISLQSRAEYLNIRGHQESNCCG